MVELDSLHPLLILTVLLSLAGAYSKPYRFNLYKSGYNPHYSSGKPTSRHKNHCAYVVEKSVSFTAQNGAAPYVKAEYNKCAWGQKCPALMYRLFYKPMYKVAYKTVTELEWRCCPGFSGLGCSAGPYAMKAMPPFKDQMPSFKGPMPYYKGPMPSYKGPIPSYKGPIPFYKGPMSQPNYKGNPWSQPKGTPSNMKAYPGQHFAPPMQSYPETSFEPYPVHRGPTPGHLDFMPDHHNPIPDDHGPIPENHDTIPEHHDTTPDHHNPMPDHHDPNLEHSETEPIPEEHVPSGGSQSHYGLAVDGVAAERLDRMEEEVQRLSLGLEKLRGTVTGLEDGLRVSLREDANRMLSALLSAAPSPGSTLALGSTDSSVGFGDLPGGAPEGLDGEQFPGLGELAGRVAELRAELQAKSAELEELRGVVLGHNGALRRLAGGVAGLTGTTAGENSQKTLEKLLDSSLGGVRAAILGGFEMRVESAEERCEERAGEVRRQCQKEQAEGQGRLEQALDGSTTGLRKELGNLQAQLWGLGPEEDCCSWVSGMAERVLLLEQSVSGLNHSQRHLQADLGGHKDHVEGMLEGRLGYVEARLNITEGGRCGGTSGGVSGTLETRVQEKLKALEGRLFAAVEELGNATAPALLEGQAMPTLETEIESLRRRVEVDMDRVQKQLSDLQVLCTSSCASSPILRGDAGPRLTEEEEDEKEEDQRKVMGRLDDQAERLDCLNETVAVLLTRLAEREEEGGLQGEVTLLKVSIHSVNLTLRGLRASLGTVAREVGHANTTWQQREDRLAQQVRGVVQLVGKQASMLGSSERRLTRLKGELQDLRRRLAGELQGCRTTALGVQKEVSEVGGRVARVEGQCGVLTHLAEDLERIRGELERYSEGYLSQVNGTLASHSSQLSELREELKNCTAGSGQSQPRGDQFTTVPTQYREEQHTAVPAQPRGDQFIVPKLGEH